MDLTLKYFFLTVLCAVCGAFIHSISRALVGKEANGYPAGIVILAFMVPPWWVAALGGALGHLLSVWIWNTLSGKRAAPKSNASTRV